MSTFIWVFFIAIAAVFAGGMGFRMGVNSERYRNARAGMLEAIEDVQRLGVMFPVTPEVIERHKQEWLDACRVQYANRANFDEEMKKGEEFFEREIRPQFMRPSVWAERGDKP